MINISGCCEFGAKLYWQYPDYTYLYDTEIRFTLIWGFSPNRSTQSQFHPQPRLPLTKVKSHFVKRISHSTTLRHAPLARRDPTQDSHTEGTGCCLILGYHPPPVLRVISGQIITPSPLGKPCQHAMRVNWYVYIYLNLSVSYSPKFLYSRTNTLN